MDRRSTVMFRTITVLTLLNTVAFGVAVSTDRPWPVALRWLPLPIIIGLAGLLTRRVRPSPAAPPEVHRYWRLTTAGILTFCATTVLRLLDAVLDVPLAPASVVLHVFGGLLMTYPLLKLPLDMRGRRAGVLLDVGTLMIATTVLILHLATPPLLSNGRLSLGDVVALGVVLIAGLGSVHTSARIALTGMPWIRRRALYAIGGSAVIGGLGSAVALLLPLPLNTNLLVLLLPWAAYAGALAARFQLTAGTAAEPRSRRGYSLMPYLAVSAVCVMLVVTAVTGARDHLFMVGFAVVVVALVIGRQLIAFRQNDALLRRIGVQEKQFRALVQNATEAVTISSADHVVRYASSAVRRVMGVDPDELIGTVPLERVHPDDRHILASTLRPILTRPGAMATCEVRYQQPDGGWKWLELTSMNLLDDPDVNGVVTNSRDITETREIRERLSHQATHDPLTGLANRSLFHDRLTAAVDRPGPRAGFSLALIDLDDFKTVNDTLGHAVGDDLLNHVAKVLRGGVRPADTVARLGGDEFAILFEDTGADDAGRVLDRLAETLLKPAVIGGEPLAVRASFGLVESRPGADAEELLRQADVAMYETKNRGAGGHLRYRPGMEARTADRRRVAEELRAAIQADHLVLHYQPVVTLPDGRITGAEALVRWQHPERGLLGPGAFVDAAEQSGVILPLGRWVLQAATREAASWADDSLSVSVNASARQLRDPHFAKDVAAALRDSGLPAGRLTLEITESTAVGGGATADMLRELRRMGVRLSLDDFGTGASSLSLLATCPVDQIKLDRSFVTPPGTDAIAVAVLQLARAFGLEAVAEGVETAEQAGHLAALGYGRAQGYHFARPMPAGDLRASLTDRLAERR